MLVDLNEAYDTIDWDIWLSSLQIFASMPTVDFKKKFIKCLFLFNFIMEDN